MNYLLLPDLAAMAMLLGILYFLRRRHPGETVDFWLVALVFIFLEAIIHAAYPKPGPWRLVAHVAALNFFYVAGAIFLWASGRDLFSRRTSLRYLLINSVPVVGLLATYGLAVHNPRIYEAIAGSGLAIGIVSAFGVAESRPLGKGRWVIGVQCCMWLPVWYFASTDSFREAAYFVLFVVYFATAVVFEVGLPRKSLGKFAIVAGFVIWSLVFLSHSWAANHPGYDAIADEVWNLQKFLVTIGMLLVLLEQQVAANEWNALHDHLTGLPNHRLFEKSLASAVEKSRDGKTRAALLMVDLNGFKLINDSHGHHIGDELLRHLSQNLRGAIRAGDVLARLGGDEFMILATDLPSDQPGSSLAAASVDRISAALRKPVSINGRAFTVTGSIGVAICPDDATDEVQLRYLADQRMYEQKRQIPLEF
jgi:diguanylate cyclase (GGDEF)-like protein